MKKKQQQQMAKTSSVLLQSAETSTLLSMSISLVKEWRTKYPANEFIDYARLIYSPCLSPAKCIDDNRLPTSSGAHNHNSVACQHGFIKLYHFISLKDE